MFWKSKAQKEAEAGAIKTTMDLSVSSQKSLEDAAKSTMSLAADVAGTLQAKIDDYASQLDMTGRLLSDALLMVDQYGVITSYNNAAKKIFGWNRKEIIGSSMSMLFDLGDSSPTIDLEYMNDFCSKVNNEHDEVGSAYHEDFMGICRDGTKIFVDVSASLLVRSDHKTFFIILVRDVSHRVNNLMMIEELARSNQELITAVNASESGLVILQPDGASFKTVFVNKGFELMTGHTRAELLDLKILDLIVDDGGQFNVRRSLSSQVTGRCDIRIHHHNRGHVHAEVSITPVRKTGNLHQWVLVFYDTTSLIEATEELTRSEAHFRAFAETSTEVLIVHNGVRILDWNSRLRDMCGYTDSEISMLSPYDLVHPLERNTARAIVDNEGISQYETLNVTKTGEVLWVAVSSQPIEWDGEPGRIAVMRDITPYRTVENQLATMRERYRSVVDNTIDLVCCFDANFKITFTNQTFRDYFDYEIEDLAGFSLLDIIPEQDHLKFIDYMQSITEDNDIRRGIHRVKRGAGMRSQDWIDRAIFNDKGEIVEYQSVARDVTHLIQPK